jgi:pimeloyl-ACP methyl ester carboxylesterase
MTALLIIALALLSLGLIYQLIGTLRDARRHPPPGQRIDVNGTRLHLRTMGSGSPVVILESGITASSLSWSGLQPTLAQYTTVCSYDRAGLAWSDSSDTPPTPNALARQLHELLSRAGLRGPFVLVGHSFGGLVVRAFAAQFPAETAGLLLLDALHHREWLEPSARQKRMLRGGVLFSRIGVVLASVGIVRLCLALLSRGSRKAPRAVLHSFGKGATAVVERVLGEVTKLPAEVLPAIRAHWSRPKSFATLARYLAALPRSSTEFVEVNALPAVPLIILSAECTGEQLASQKELASLCAGGKHHLIPGCGHWVHLDKPEAVVETVREILEQVRTAQRIS